MNKPDFYALMDAKDYDSAIKYIAESVSNLEYMKAINCVKMWLKQSGPAWKVLYQYYGAALDAMGKSDEAAIALRMEKSTELLPSGDIISVKLKNGFSVFGFNGELVMREIMKEVDFYEKRLLDLWFKNVGNFQTIFDIGANIGNHTLYFASQSPSAKVFSFEPMQMNYRLLEANIAANNLGSQISLFNNAVGAENGCAYMKVETEGNNGTASIIEHEQVDSEQVEVIVIDELDLPTPDFVKIDTEGFEPQVLRGMVKTLAKSNALVWIEVDEENAAEVYDIMQSIDFSAIDFDVFGTVTTNWNILFGKNDNGYFPNSYIFTQMFRQQKSMISYIMSCQKAIADLKANPAQS